MPGYKASTPYKAPQMLEPVQERAKSKLQNHQVSEAYYGVENSSIAKKPSSIRNIAGSNRKEGSKRFVTGPGLMNSQDNPVSRD